MNTITFRHSSGTTWTRCTPLFGYYNNGLNALRLMRDGECIATASVNPEDWQQVADDELVVKDWSENEGMLMSLIDAGIVAPPHRALPAGFVEAHVCKLLVDPAALDGSAS